MSTSISATEIGLPDNAKLKLGTGEDLQIYHDGTSSILKNTTGSLFVQNDNTRIVNAANSETIATFIADGAVDLYHNGSKKFETTSIGVTVTGAINASSNVTLSGGSFSTPGNLDLGDSSGTASGRVLLGAGDDLQIYHDGTNNIISSEGAGQRLTLQSNGSVHATGTVVRIKDENNSETMAEFTADGAVELYYDNAKRFETLTDGTQSRGLTKHLSEDQNVTQTIQPIYLSIPTNSTKTITLTLLLGTGRFTAGGYANAGQGALALNIFFGGAMFATQHYDVNVLQNNAMQNTSTSLTKNGTSYVIAITNNSSSYPLNLSMLLESTGRTMNYAVA